MHHGTVATDGMVSPHTILPLPVLREREEERGELGNVRVRDRRLSFPPSPVSTREREARLRRFND
jgi:hypothetical protein